jgi:hypothetical protein
MLLYALAKFRLAHMDLLINAFGTRIHSSGERFVLALPGGNAKYKTKKEYPVRALEKIIILHPSPISTAQGGSKCLLMQPIGVA